MAAPWPEAVHTRSSPRILPTSGLRRRSEAAIALTTNALLASSSREIARTTSRVPREGRTPGMMSPSKVNDL
jgi:hypothetical protein